MQCAGVCYSVVEVGEFELAREEGEPKMDWNLRAFGAKRKSYEIANKTNK